MSQTLSITYDELQRLHAAAADTVRGDCAHSNCPQLRDGEPKATGRHCPLDIEDADEVWMDDEGNWCDRCHGDGRDPWTDYLLPCPACQGEQH